MAEHTGSLVILIPNFNDWEPLELLLDQLDPVAGGLGWRISVLVVDDASTLPLPPGWPARPPLALAPIEILHLRANLGHQRAIALGLYHIHETRPGSTVLVMDGDGEDRPADLADLLDEYERSGRRDCVFAARGKRMNRSPSSSFTGSTGCSTWRLPASRFASAISACCRRKPWPA